MARSDFEDTPRLSAVRQMLNFLGGVFVGLVLAPAGVLAAVTLFILILSITHPPNAPAGPFLLATSGADISRSGGSVIQVRRQLDEFRQDCRGVCDDVRFEDAKGELLVVRVLDARGACVVCRETSGDRPSAASERWRISGAPRLLITKGGGRE